MFKCFGTKAIITITSFFVAPPKIKNKMEDISIHADLLLKMTVEIEGIPEPKVQFYKDGKEIKASERVKIVKEGEKYSLVMEKSALTDSG